MAANRIDLSGRGAVVTGGAAGLGYAIAERILASGADVCIWDLNEGVVLAAVSGLNGADAGGTASGVVADVSDPKAVAEATAASIGQLGAIDVLVNNAGVSHRAGVEDTTSDAWDKVIDVNVKGVFLGTKAVIPAMRSAGGGSIINISSIYGLVGSVTSTAYHASKGAVRIFNKSTAIQYASENIRANSVHPGFVDSPMTRAHHDNPNIHQERVSKMPLGRMGQPEDIAAGILYLASDESSFVTGAELVIDGGLTAQ